MVAVSERADAELAKKPYSVIEVRVALRIQLVVMGMAALPLTVEPGTRVKLTLEAVVETVNDSANEAFRVTVGALELRLRAYPVVERALRLRWLLR